MMSKMLDLLNDLVRHREGGPVMPVNMMAVVKISELAAPLNVSNRPCNNDTHSVCCCAVVVFLMGLHKITSSTVENALMLTVQLRTMSDWLKVSNVPYIVQTYYTRRHMDRPFQ